MTNFDVIVVGCGVFGLSAALELARKGYKVLALDPYPVPSAFSAANDYNKILRVEYSDQMSAELAVEAMKYWETDPLYTPYYLKTGRLTLAPADANLDRARYEQKSWAVLDKLGVRQNVETLTTPAQVGARIPGFGANTLPAQFSASYNTDCATGLAAKALVGVHAEAERRGVEFRFGAAGRVQTVCSHSVTVKSGATYRANKILVTAGAATGLLVPLDNQTKVFGTFVAHIKLSPEEYHRYKAIPIFFSAQHGYFFPPDEETHHIKIGITTCDAYAETAHPFEAGKTLRVPRYTAEHPTEILPRRHREDVRRLLALMVPELSHHELVDFKTCWVADSCDSYFLIDECPHLKDVFVATGDSSHSFKFLPTVGKYIVERMEGELRESYRERWAWKYNPVFGGGNAKSRYPRPHYNVAARDPPPGGLGAKI